MMLLLAVACCQANAQPIELNAWVSLKQPGNMAVTYPLRDKGNLFSADTDLPLVISKQMTKDGDDEKLTVTVTANQRVYFNLNLSIPTHFATDDCEFYLPGFWYHKNLRSPQSAPSFHTSKSWNFREDRLSSPLSGVYDNKSGKTLSVLRHLDGCCDALTTHQEGEVILSGKTSLGYLGFDNSSGLAAITFGYPYMETPQRYIRKLTLVNPIVAFAKLEKGEQSAKEKGWLSLSEVEKELGL